MDRGNLRSTVIMDKVVLSTRKVFYFLLYLQHLIIANNLVMSCGNEGTK